MALIKCPECKRKISDKSAQCIGCGYPITPIPPVSPTNAVVTPVAGDKQIILGIGTYISGVNFPAGPITFSLDSRITNDEWIRYSVERDYGMKGLRHFKSDYFKDSRSITVDLLNGNYLEFSCYLKRTKLQDIKIIVKWK